MHNQNNFDIEKKVLSTINSLKEVVTIVTGVTITNAIVVLITGGTYLNIRSFEEFELKAIICFILLIANIIRFYHGNIRHLDDTYAPMVRSNASKDVKLIHPRFIGLDFFVIFAQSVLFAAMSFYINKATEYFCCFLVLLIVDVVWFLYLYRYTPNRQVFDHQKKWSTNNILTLLALLIIAALANVLSSGVHFYFFVVILNVSSGF